MNPERPEQGENAPPPVPDQYRRENPYTRPNPPESGWPNPTEEVKPKPFNPYAVGLNEQPGMANPYQVPFGYYNPSNPSNPYGQSGYNNPYRQPEYSPYNQQQIYGWQTQTTPRSQPTAAPRVSGYGVFWTYFLLAAIGVVFVLQIAVQGGGSNLFGMSMFSIDTLINMGALQKELIREGEIWRLVSPMFLHAGFIHILFNGLALWSIGKELESQMGPVRFLMIYFVGGLLGSLLSFGLGNPLAVGVGASGAIFALLGGLIGFLLRHRNIFGHYGRAQLSSLIFTAVLNFVILLSIPQVDNLAHLGGLVGGMFLGYFLPSDYKQSAQGGSRLVGWWSVLALVAIEVALLVVFMGSSPGNTIPVRAF
jgi:rhomboid protease GluP